MGVSTTHYYAFRDHADFAKTLVRYVERGIQKGTLYMKDRTLLTAEWILSHGIATDMDLRVIEDALVSGDLEALEALKANGLEHTRTSGQMLAFRRSTAPKSDVEKTSGTRKGGKAK